jgi:hypothetical protein
MINRGDSDHAVVAAFRVPVEAIRRLIGEPKQ